MIRCDTDAERQALKDLTFAAYKVLTAGMGEVKEAKAKLQGAYDRLADVVIGMKKPSRSERYHR
jgi:hypothetical protein